MFSWVLSIPFFLLNVSAFIENTELSKQIFYTLTVTLGTAIILIDKKDRFKNAIMNNLYLTNFIWALSYVIKEGYIDLKFDLSLYLPIIYLILNSWMIMSKYLVRADKDSNA